MSDARTAPTSPAFDEFLFAVIREETNGTPLSMISALSRLGLEPWQEATRLAALPAAAAAEALATLIGRLPQGAAAAEPADRNRLVAGLVELLPKPGLLPPQEASSAALREMPGLLRRAPNVLRELQGPRRYLWLLCIVLTAALMLTWLSAPGAPTSDDPPPPSASFSGR
jgi:hypothetical protein